MAVRTRSVQHSQQLSYEKKRNLQFEHTYSNSVAQSIKRHSRAPSINPPIDLNQPKAVRPEGRLFMSTAIRFTCETELAGCELPTPRGGRVIQTPKSLNPSQYFEYMSNRTDCLTARLPTDERISRADLLCETQTPLNTVESLPDVSSDDHWKNEKYLQRTIVQIGRDAARLRTSLLQAQEKIVKLMCANKRKDDEIKALKGSSQVLVPSDRLGGECTPRKLPESSVAKSAEVSPNEEKEVEERCEALGKAVNRESEVTKRQRGTEELQSELLLRCEMELKAEREKNEALERKLSAVESTLSQELMQQKSAVSQLQETIAALKSVNSGLETKTQEFEARAAQVAADIDRQKQRIAELEESLRSEQNQKSQYKENYENECRKLQLYAKENEELSQLLDTALTPVYELIATQLKSAGSSPRDVCIASDSDTWLVTIEVLKDSLAQCGVEVARVPIQALARVCIDADKTKVDLARLEKKLQ